MQKEDTERIPNIERQGWSAEELAEEASVSQTDEIVRRVLRGDETDGDPNDRDIVGRVESNETPHGRKEVKHNTGSK